MLIKRIINWFKFRKLLKVLHTGLVINEHFMEMLGTCIFGNKEFILTKSLVDEDIVLNINLTEYTHKDFGKHFTSVTLVLKPESLAYDSLSLKDVKIFMRNDPIHFDINTHYYKNMEQFYSESILIPADFQEYIKDDHNAKVLDYIDGTYIMKFTLPKMKVSKQAYAYVLTTLENYTLYQNGEIIWLPCVITDVDYK